MCAASNEATKKPLSGSQSEAEKLRRGRTRRRRKRRMKKRVRERRKSRRRAVLLVGAEQMERQGGRSGINVGVPRIRAKEDREYCGGA